MRRDRAFLVSIFIYLSRDSVFLVSILLYLRRDRIFIVSIFLQMRRDRIFLVSIFSIWDVTGYFSSRAHTQRQTSCKFTFELKTKLCYSFISSKTLAVEWALRGQIISNINEYLLISTSNTSGLIGPRLWVDWIFVCYYRYIFCTFVFPLMPHRSWDSHD